MRSPKQTTQRTERRQFVSWLLPHRTSLSNILIDSRSQLTIELQSQFQLHIDRARHRVRTVRSDFLESQLAIHGNRIFHHRLHGVKAHALVADLAGLVDNSLSQSASHAFATKLWPQEKPLHFAD